MKHSVTPTSFIQHQDESFQVKKPKQYEKWRKLLTLHWELDEKKKKILDKEVDMESIEAENLHAQTVRSYRKA